MSEHHVAPAASGESAIHDLSYRRYHGSRVGRSGAWRALFAQSFRAMFGIGRPLKSKAIAIVVVVLSVLPALAGVTATSQSNGAIPLRYAQLVGAQLFLLVLFVAAQVPEVLSRDQQHRVLALVFTRDVSRNAYTLARFAAVYCAMFLVALAPLVFLYFGEMGIAADPTVAFHAMGHKIWPVLAFGALCALVLSGLSGALAAWTPRRAYATTAIFGAFLLLAAVSTGVDQLSGLGMREAELVDPIRTLRTMGMVLFHETNRGMTANPPFALSVYVAYALGIGATGGAILWWRVRRLPA
jgi:ABC-2 type transport system permease protein